MAKPKKSADKGKKGGKAAVAAKEKHGADNFTFGNRDTYTGYYTVSVQGRIWKQGSGIYKTGDGHIYQGNWENDCLIDDVHITFPDKSYYFGPVENLQYTGKGTYVFSDNSRIETTFTNNRPTGLISLLDTDNNLWQGIAETERAVLMPTNRFLPRDEKPPISQSLNNEDSEK